MTKKIKLLIRKWSRERELVGVKQRKADTVRQMFWCCSSAQRMAVRRAAEALSDKSFPRSGSV